jgi:cytidylate kinase
MPSCTFDFLSHDDRTAMDGAKAIVITIDGPAGTGKSSVALAVAERLHFDFLDTGAMYRAIGLEAVRRNANLEDSRELAFIARHCKIEFEWSKHPPGVLLNG